MRAERSRPRRYRFFERGADLVCDLVRNIFAMNGCTTELIASGVSHKGYEFV